MTDAQLVELYDSFWLEALGHFKKGQVELDAYLAGARPDHRLGLSVIARPSRQLIDQIAALIGELAQIEPDQYYYDPGELHITVLSLFTATEDFQPYFDKIPIYLAALAPVLSTTQRFTIYFRGISATKNTVMVQGFPQDETLERLRDGIRDALRSNGLGEGLDQRYRIVTAHTSILRFRTAPRDPEQLVSVLERYREYDFGELPVESLQFVKNDWYMSADKVEVLREYQLV